MRNTCALLDLAREIKCQGSRLGQCDSAPAPAVQEIKSKRLETKQVDSPIAAVGSDFRHQNYRGTRVVSWSTALP